MFLVRKISLARWESGDTDGISADAVTLDLRTQENSLSLWRVPSATAIDEAVLALAAEGDRLDKVDVAWVREDEVIGAGLTLVASPGKTRVPDLVHSHVDLQDLNYGRLRQFVQQVYSGPGGENRRRFAKREVADILAGAILEKRLPLSDLEPKMREAVERASQSATG